MTIYNIHHEACECGHCRCRHLSGYEACGACKRCRRYTWPGPGADLPPRHAGARERVPQEG